MQGRELASAPVMVCATRDGLVIGSDAGEWCAVVGDRSTSGGAARSGDAGPCELRPLPATGPVSAAAVDAAGVLNVVCWEASVKQLRDGSWTDVALGAVPLALVQLASSDAGGSVTHDGLARAGVTALVAGDTSGGLLIVPTTARIPVQELTAPEPIVELHALPEALVVLGARGALGVTGWPRVADAPLVSVATASIGHVYAAFAGMRAGTLVLAGARGIGILEHGRVTGVSELADRIRTVAAFRGHDRACLVTDAGDAWLVDTTLARVGRLQIGDPLAGAVAAPDGSVLAWTQHGTLHVVERDGKTTRVAEHDVVLGAPDPADPHGYLAVHWTPTSTRITKGRATWI